MRNRVRLAILTLVSLMLVPAGALAQDPGAVARVPAMAAAVVFPVPQASTGQYVARRGWHVDFLAEPATAALAPALALPFEPPSLAPDASPQRPRPVAFEYSDAYRTRRKIHVYASIAMLPLFVTQYALGQSLYTTSTDSKRSAHAVVGSGIGVVFGLNTVTGVWNLWEGRKDPSHRTRRLTHGILMLGADAGFLATAMLSPGDDGGGNRSAHRAVALTSMGVATASYLFMLLTR